MSEIPREMIENRAVEIARKEGRKTRPNDVDYARAEDLLRAELEAKPRQMADTDAPDETTGGLDPKGNPAPPPH